ncbi:MAG: flagellar motor protein MotB [Candidatus Hydrogenedentes bacterium]|nr:flagellar motor protein MotB [Candidatus Hydrogenedentota bacterium]
MARQKKSSMEPPGVPGWMVTYGDLMTLLLTFFVLLLSFSTISEDKLNEAMTSVLSALGVMPDNMAVVQVLRSNVSPRIPRRAERIARELRRMLQVMGKEEDVEIEYDKQGGLKINLPSRVLFDSARAEVKADARPILSKLGELLAEIPEKFIEIRGHTDDRPLKDMSVYKDNYDLSYHRAKNVMLFMHEEGGIPRSEFEVIACGEWQPVATNDTPEGRQRNRRVELYVRGQFEDDTMREMRDMIDSLGISEEGAGQAAAPAR